MAFSIKKITIGLHCVLAALLGQAQTNGLFIDSSAQLRPLISVELTAATLAHAERQEDFGGLLALFLKSPEGISRIPVTGHYSKTNNVLSFQPLVKLGNNLHFIIKYATPEGTILQSEYRTPKAVVLYKNPPEVADIYPVSDNIPENILCFHVLFDRPMAQDPEAYKKARIIHNGTEVPLVWKHTAYWTHGGKLLVLMVHPGRVKRGISYLGKAFEIGQTYTLLIEKEIQDPQGRILTEQVEKHFTIGKADHKIPKLRKGHITFPETPDSSPITLTFSEAMDFACMVEGVEVLDANNNLLPISISHIDDERYEIRPEKSWSPGTYQLVLKPVVGDLCGNRFHKKFETTKKPTQQELNTNTVYEFEVSE